MAFYFFTEPTALVEQTLVKHAFGPQEVNGNLTTHFQVGSIHKAIGKDPLAYSVCNGLVRYQEDELNAELLTAVLRPSQRIIEGIPILYFIYRGIKRSSLTASSNGDLVAPIASPVTQNSVHIIDRIHYYQQKINQRNGTAIVPNIEQLGTGFKTTAIAPFTRTDDDTIQSIFFENSSIKPVNIDTGMVLGNFHQDYFAFEIVLDGLMNEPRMADLRKISAQDNTANANLPGNIIKATNLDETLNKPVREKVLHYMDPCAFYGLQFKDGVVIKDENSGQTTAKEETLASLLSKFLNRNTCYIDIRNENGLSFNYYNVIPEKILLNTDETTLSKNGKENILLRVSPNPVDYETNKWPINIIKKDIVSIKPASNQIGLRLSLPIGEAITAVTQRIVYLNHSIFYYNNSQIQKVPNFNSKDRFQDLITKNTTGGETYTPDFTITSYAANFTEGGSPVLRPVAFYHKLSFIKQHSSPVQNDNVVRTSENFDNLFIVKNIENYTKWSTANLASQYFLTAQEKYIFKEDGFIEGVVQTGVAIDSKGTALTEKRITFFHILISEKNVGNVPVLVKPFVESALNNGTGSITNPPVPVQYDSFFSSYHSGLRDINKLDLILYKTVIDTNPDLATSNSKVFIEYRQNGNNTRKHMPYTADAVKCISMSFDEYGKLITKRDAGGFDLSYHPVFIQQQVVTPVVGTGSTISYNTMNLKLAGLHKQSGVFYSKEEPVPATDVALQARDYNLFFTQAAALLEPLAYATKHTGFKFYGSKGKAHPDFVDEERHFLRALEDIKTYNPEFYGALQRAFIFGNKVYYHENPDVPTSQLGIIHIAISNTVAGGGETKLEKTGEFIGTPVGVGLPAGTEHNYHIGVFPGSTNLESVNPNRIKLGGTERPFPKSRLKDGSPNEEHDQFASVKAYRDLNVNNLLDPAKIDELYKPLIQVSKPVQEELVPAFLKGKPYDTKYDNNPLVSYEEALRLGFGTNTGNVFIRISSNYKEPDTPLSNCSFYSELRYVLLSYLSHELGHALSFLQDSLRNYLWGEIEAFYGGRSDFKLIYPLDPINNTNNERNENLPLIKIPDDISISPTLVPDSGKYTKNGIPDIPFTPNTFTGDSTYDSNLQLVAKGFKSKFGEGHIRGNIGGTVAAQADLITMLNYTIAVNDELIKNSQPYSKDIMPKCGYLYYNLDIRAYYIPAKIINEYDSLSTKYSK